MKPSGPASWNPDPDSGISIEWVEANGLTFEVATAGEGNHLALFLHGFPELHYSWRDQIPLLSEMGYRVWAPNLRGYGGTSRPEGVRAYALDNLVEDIAALIDASGASKVTLFAHDWGGAIAWCFAILAPRKLERFVVMNLPHPLAFRRELKSWRQLRKSWYIYFFQIPLLPEKLLGRSGAKPIANVFAKTSCNPQNFGPEVLATYVDAAARPGALTAMLNYYRAVVRHARTLDLGDGMVDVPTLMIWGEQDVALDVRGTEGTDRWVPDFTLERLPEASHWVQQDAPDTVNAILKQWLPKAQA